MGRREKRARQKAARREREPERSLGGRPQRAQASEDARPLHAAPVPIDPLVAVRQRARRVSIAEARLAESVALARASGVSWAALGQEFGITGEGARRRWGQVA